MTLGPVVPGAGLPKHKVIRPENLSIRPRSDAVHCPWFKIHENRPRNKPATTGFVVVDINSLQLQIGIPMVPSGGVDAVLGAHHLPELGSDLVAALAALDVENLTHFLGKIECESREKTGLQREMGGNGEADEFIGGS